MNKRIEKISNFRQFLLRQVDGLSAQQFNFVPQGFNNNIIWNLGHLIAAVQNMCYVRSGQAIAVEEQYFLPFLPGTKPNSLIDGQEIAKIRALFISSINRLAADFDAGIFRDYRPSEKIPEIYGVEVRNIDEALDFLLYHEGLHVGYVFSLKHAVKE